MYLFAVHSVNPGILSSMLIALSVLAATIPAPLMSQLLLQVLSDPDKRKVFDQFGEDGLKGGIPPGAANGGAMPGGFPAGGFAFRPGNAEDIFSQVTITQQSAWQNCDELCMVKSILQLSLCMEC